MASSGLHLSRALVSHLGHFHLRIIRSINSFVHEINMIHDLNTHAAHNLWPPAKGFLIAETLPAWSLRRLSLMSKIIFTN